MGFVTEAGHLTVLAVFALAGWHKARGRQGFAAFGDALAALVPGIGRATGTAAAAVVAAELGTAGLLAVGLVVDGAAVAGLGLAGLLLAAFTVALAGALRRGEPVPCGCLGASPAPVGRRHVVRNAGLLGLVAVSLGGHLAGHPAVDLATTVAAAAVAVATAAGLRALAVTAATAVVGLAWCRLARTYAVVTVRGHSMAPTLVPGDRVLLHRRRARPVRRGDVVVIALPGATDGGPRRRSRRDLGDSWVVKRVAAVAGEPVPHRSTPATVPEVVVPAGRLVLLGDSSHSFDSRRLGFFSSDDLLGVVVRRLGPDPANAHRWAGATVPAPERAGTVERSGSSAGEDGEPAELHGGISSRIGAAAERVHSGTNGAEHRRGRRGAMLEVMSDDIAGVLLAIAAGVDEEAIRRAAATADRSAPGSPEHRLADALRRHLDGGRGDVYDDPAAFERFVDGGGNVELYRRAEAALAGRHADHRPRTVLDVGCGDGRLTRAALRPGLTRLDLVEPSAELLAAAEARLAPDLGATSLVPHPGTAQDLVAGLPDEDAGAATDPGDDGDDGRWDVAQSTFALHALRPDDRHRVLTALAGRVRHLLVVEFDVPPFADRGLDHARYAAGRYVEGVAEYAGDDLVVDGFLVPVLAGQFAPDRPRHTWEQPADAWVADLAAAGFTDVRATLLHRYWWAPAHLLEATGAAGGQ